MSELPRYRCTLEKGFLDKPREVLFANGQVGFNQRVEYGAEFSTDQVPGKWMEPINEAARQRVAELVEKGQRKSEHAERTVSLTPLKPPKQSGLRALTDAEAFNSPVVTDVPVADDLPRQDRAPPRRRKAN